MEEVLSVLGPHTCSRWFFGKASQNHFCHLHVPEVVLSRIIIFRVGERKHKGEYKQDERLEHYSNLFPSLIQSSAGSWRKMQVKGFICFFLLYTYYNQSVLQAIRECAPHKQKKEKTERKKHKILSWVQQ